MYVLPNLVACDILVQAGVEAQAGQSAECGCSLLSSSGRVAAGLCALADADGLVHVEPCHIVQGRTDREVVEAVCCMTHSNRAAQGMG
jgi:hypothetical protein